MIPETLHYTLGDCVDGMKQFPDNYFDLAIVDPPYGDAKQDENGCNSGGGYWQRFGQRFDRYKVQPIRRMVEPIQNATTGGVFPEPAGRGLKSTAKKLLRGTQPRKRNISTNFSASHATK